MGMDVMGKNGGVLFCRHSGWGALADALEEKGVDTAEFRMTNDGDPILEKTCLAVADALEQHGLADDLARMFNLEHAKWGDGLTPPERLVSFWRNCGGCAQW